MNIRQIKATTSGGTFTRTTDRNYTHVVIVCGLNEDKLEDDQRERLKYLNREAESYRKVLREGLPPGSRSTLDEYRGFLESAEERLLNLPEEYEAKLEESRQAIRDRNFKCQHWCGRFDLAKRATTGLHAIYHLVEIHPVDPEFVTA